MSGSAGEFTIGLAGKDRNKVSGWFPGGDGNCVKRKKVMDWMPGSGFGGMVVRSIGALCGLGRARAE